VRPGEKEKKRKKRKKRSHSPKLFLVSRDDLLLFFLTLLLCKIPMLGTVFDAGKTPEFDAPHLIVVLDKR
jgi:hypothetical protein